MHFSFLEIVNFLFGKCMKNVHFWIGKMHVFVFEKCTFFVSEKCFFCCLISTFSGILTCSSRHGCISDASLRRLMQRLRDISKRADLQISERSAKSLIKDVSLEMSLKSLRFSQRRLLVTSETVNLGLQTKVLFIQGMTAYLFISLWVVIFFAKLN